MTFIQSPQFSLVQEKGTETFTRQLVGSVPDYFGEFHDEVKEVRPLTSVLPFVITMLVSLCSMVSSDLTRLLNVGPRRDWVTEGGT